MTDVASGGAPPSYWDYLRLDRLLDLQGGLEGDEAQLMPDELHFIVVHQTLELWFKLVLRELRLARDELGADFVPETTVPLVVHHVGRVNSILALAVDQFRVMETLTPQDFLAFRDKLMPASGFQSFQMRELEILAGLSLEERRAAGLGDPLGTFRGAADGSPGTALAKARIEAVLGEETLRSALYRWLGRTPIQGSAPGAADDAARVEGFVSAYLEAMARHGEAQQERFTAVGVLSAGDAEARIRGHLEGARAFLEARDVDDEAARATARRVRAALLFIESYRDLPLLSWPRTLIDAVVELEEQLVLFRHRHARMVERIIGRRTGTGGSDGVDYLDRTTKMRIFRELWMVRTILLPREAVPPLEQPEVYGFQVG